MKKILIAFLILLCTPVLATAQPLTKTDLQSLDVKLTKLQETVTDIDKRLAKLEVTVTEMDKRLTNNINETNKRLSNQIAVLDIFVRWAIGVLVLVVLAVIALPQLLGYLRDK
jgi:hypothetical protein